MSPKVALSTRRSSLYIEALSGVAGDMLLGAFLDLGVPPENFYDAWNSLDLDNYEVEILTTQKAGMKALQCRVKTEEKSGPRNWKQFSAILNRSKLPRPVREQSISLCRRLFEVEAGIHRTPIDQLHLHEMGGTDLLIDVVGTLTAIDYLQPLSISASAVNTGRGFVSFSHGRYLVPTPAASTLLLDCPVFQNEVEGELTTPTGALLVTHLAKSYGPLPQMMLQAVGVGAGEREIPGHPNVVRIFAGSLEKAGDGEETYMIETNIDDSNPQVLAYFMEKAFENGALDVFFTPIFMKKNRPAVRLSVLVERNTMDNVVRLLFTETTAIGLRYWRVDRQKLERRWKTIRLDGCEIRIKESYLGKTLYNHQPEYEDCKEASEKLNRPLKEVLAQATHAYLNGSVDE